MEAKPMIKGNLRVARYGQRGHFSKNIRFIFSLHLIINWLLGKVAIQIPIYIFFLVKIQIPILN